MKQFLDYQEFRVLYASVADNEGSSHTNGILAIIDLPTGQLGYMIDKHIELL